LGPHTPPFPLIRDEGTIRLLADLGVVFLMFSVGLEFNLRRLRKTGVTAGVTALLDVAVMLWLGFHLGRAMGWSRIESLFLGGIICDSSTTILARTLQELGRTREKFAGIAVGVTLVEDILAVAVIAILTGVAVTGAWHASMLADRFWALTIFLTAVTLIGLLTLPRLLNAVDRLRDPELLLLVLLGIGCTVTLAADSLRLSLALGAVLVGALASESRAAHRITALMDPLRHMFGAIFFVAVGLMLDPGVLLRHAGPILLVTFLIVAAKFCNTALGALLTGHDMPLAIRVGASLAQVGEFAFIIAALGATLGVTEHPVYQVGVAAAVLSIVVNQPLVALAERLAASVERRPACPRWTAAFHLYGQLAERIGQRRKPDAVGRALRRNVATMVVCAALVALTIAAAGYLAHKAPAALPGLRLRPWLPAFVCWLGAMMVCLPFYAAFFGKLEGLSMLLAEIAIPAGHVAPWARPARAFISHAIRAAGFIGVAILTFLLSFTFFDSRAIVLLLMAGMGMAGFFGWRKVARVYRQARETLEAMTDADALDAENAATATPAATFADEALAPRTASVTIPPGAAADGLELRTLLLRTRTGATVISIERDGRQLINPDPNAILHVGDSVLLLGDAEQIRRAQKLLSRPDAS
jgi:CPA2 family monovalent cation:H+ antiporter-2